MTQKPFLSTNTYYPCPRFQVNCEHLKNMINLYTERAANYIYGSPLRTENNVIE